MYPAYRRRERRSPTGRRYPPSAIVISSRRISLALPRISAGPRGIVAILQPGLLCSPEEQNDCHSKASDCERERAPDVLLGGSSGERAQREPNEHDGGHYPAHEKAREIAARRLLTHVRRRRAPTGSAPARKDHPEHEQALLDKRGVPYDALRREPLRAEEIPAHPDRSDQREEHGPHAGPRGQYLPREATGHRLSEPAQVLRQ